jgi:prophage regulatory protein
MSNERAEPVRMMRLAEVLEVVHISQSRLFEMIHLGLFPKPIKISMRLTAWLTPEVAAWQSERIQERDKKVAAGAPHTAVEGFARHPENHPKRKAKQAHAA